MVKRKRWKTVLPVEKRKPLAPKAVAERLAKAKALVAAGKFEIGNAAALAGPNDVRAVAGFRKGVIIFQWSRAGIGFGELTFVVKDGKLRVEREGMSDGFCLDVLRQALKEAGGRDD